VQRDGCQVLLSGNGRSAVPSVRPVDRNSLIAPENDPTPEWRSVGARHSQQEKGIGPMEA